MKSLTAVLVAAILSGGALRAEQGQSPPERITVAFSDATRAGRIEIHAYGGSVTIVGTNRKDTLITARARSGAGRRGDRPPLPGSRRLSKSNGFDVTEALNVVAVSTDTTRAGYDFQIEVPRRTHLDVFLVDGNEVSIRDVDGDLEVDNSAGNVILANVSGAVVVAAVKGSIRAVIARTAADTPMSFTTLTGDVDVTFPADVRATFKLRSDHGEITTNLDLRVTSTSTRRSETRRNAEPPKIEVRRSLIGTVNGGGPEIELRSFNGSVFLRQGK